MALGQVDTSGLFTVASVMEPAPVGDLYIVGLWHPDTGTWEMTVPTIIIGQVAGVRCQGDNPSMWNQNMRMDIQITDPLGAVLTASGAVHSVGPFSSFVEEFKWPAALVGEYRATLILLAEWAF